MTFEKNPIIPLRHILQSIKLIERRLKGIILEDFEEDIDLQDMTTRRLEIVGEAVKRLEKQFKDKYPEIRWRKPADMRNILILEYDDINWKIVWDTVKDDIPILKGQIKDLLKQLKPKT